MHEAISDRWPRQSRIEEGDFLLDVFHPRSPYTVATSAGLVHPEGAEDDQEVG